MIYFFVSGLICFSKILYSLEIKKDEEIIKKINSTLDLEDYDQKTLLYSTAFLFGWLIIPLWLVNKVFKIV